MIKIQPLVGHKNVKRGSKMIQVESVTPVDEVLDDGYRVGLAYRVKGANLIELFEISESTREEILDALASRDRQIAPVDFELYDDRQVVKQPHIGDHDDGS